MEAPWLSTVLNMLGDILDQCAIIKRSQQGCFCGQGAQGSAIITFNLLAVWKHVLHREGFYVNGATQASTTKVYQHCWKEWVV